MFQPGNVVKLKSGGIKMTVNREILNSDSVYCVWFDKENHIQGGRFSIDILKLVKK